MRKKNRGKHFIFFEYKEDIYFKQVKKELLIEPQISAMWNFILCLNYQTIVIWNCYLVETIKQRMSKIRNFNFVADIP